MPSTLSLSTAQRNTLLHYYRRHLDPAMRLRAHIILMLAEGYPWSVITLVLFCSACTINHCKHRFEAGGVEALFGRPRACLVNRLITGER